MTPVDPTPILGRLLLFAGVVLAAAGLLLILGKHVPAAGRLPRLGHLPGDIVWGRGTFRLYLPITTCLLLSLGLTLLLAIVNLFRR